MAARVARLGAEDSRALLRAYVGERSNRRHRPGRAFERTGYRFDVVTDYGAFRDLQRHRMLTIEWQPLGTRLGYDVPDVVERPDCPNGMPTRSSARGSWPKPRAQLPGRVGLRGGARLPHPVHDADECPEAMHLLELRSGTQGHPSYRWVAQEMHRQIAQRAGHRLLAEAMSHVDFGADELERLAAERRAEERRNPLPPVGNPAIR